jgi:hypothetical protein
MRACCDSLLRLIRRISCGNPLVGAVALSVRGGLCNPFGSDQCHAGSRLSAPCFCVCIRSIGPQYFMLVFLYVPCRVLCTYSTFAPATPA